VLQARPSPTKLVAGRGSGGHRCGRAAGDEVGRGVGQDRRIIARQVAAHGIETAFLAAGVWRSFRQPGPNFDVVNEVWKGATDPKFSTNFKVKSTPQIIQLSSAVAS
jgi:hypothetical protein